MNRFKLYPSEDLNEFPDSAENSWKTLITFVFVSIRFNISRIDNKKFS